MAPTIKWQRWDSTSYNWFGTNANDALPSLEAEIDAWIAAVNGNPSNVDQQVTKLRGYASSTTANYAGFVVSIGSRTAAEDGYFAFGAFGSTSFFQFHVGDNYDNGTGMGGYGSISNGNSDTNLKCRTSGYEANWLIAYDTTDGQEFFHAAPTYNTRDTAYEDGFGFAKLTDNHWVILSGDGTSREAFASRDGYGWITPSYDKTTGYASAEVSGTGTQFITRFNIESKQKASGSIISDEAVWYAANPNLMSMPVASSSYCTGDRLIYNDLGDGTNVYMLTLGSYGPRLFVDLR